MEKFQEIYVLRKTTFEKLAIFLTSRNTIKNVSPCLIFLTFIEVLNSILKKRYGIAISAHDVFDKIL